MVGVDERPRIAHAAYRAKGSTVTVHWARAHEVAYYTLYPPARQRFAALQIAPKISSTTIKTDNGRIRKVTIQATNVLGVRSPAVKAKRQRSYP